MCFLHFLPSLHTEKKNCPFILSFISWFPSQKMTKKASRVLFPLVECALQWHGCCRCCRWMRCQMSLFALSHRLHSHHYQRTTINEYRWLVCQRVGIPRGVKKYIRDGVWRRMCQIAACMRNRRLRGWQSRPLTPRRSLACRLSSL